MSPKLSIDVSVARRVTEAQLELLKPYLLGEEPKANGEWDMYCPLHEDTNRSSSLNIKKAEWYCNVCGGMKVARLISMKGQWVGPSSNTESGRSSDDEPEMIPSEAMIAGWASALQGRRKELRAFSKRRGISKKAIKQFQIGWCAEKNAYTIPVRNWEGGFWNVRFYQLDVPDDRRKIWGIRGLNEVRLFPVQRWSDEADDIIICEGELDAIIAIQNGFHAITRTGAAKVWKGQWNEMFRGKRVYLAHDADLTGVAANNALAAHLKGVAREVRVIQWPYEIAEKHGKDLTDFLKEHSAGELRQLMKESKVDSTTRRDADVETLDPSDASVLETFDSRRVGDPMRIIVTVDGKQEPGYSIPRKVSLRCTMNAGKRCNDCPLFGARGRATITIDPQDPTCLEIIDSSRHQVREILREKFGITTKCDKIDLDVEEHQAVEILYARPSVDHVHGQGLADYNSRKITSIGRHDTAANTTAAIVGALHPDPRRHRNEFLAWEVVPQETSLDTFESTPEIIDQLRVFQPEEGQRALAKRVEVARNLSDNITNIVGRDEMHVAMDLVFHSTLAFNFDSQRVDRGWVELLVVGDTRTGKSEVATRLIDHYRVGEIVNCEAASLAGIIGGVQQHGGSSEWTINWGVLPINDRRLAVLDEVTGLSVEEISQMSSVRSSGEARITKIKGGRTSARTRLIWLTNCRFGRLDNYTYGVDAIPSIIGNPEDIARFDLAMSVKFDPKLASMINSQREPSGLKYSSDACHNLVMWAWSRRDDQIQFTPAAVRAVYKAAKDLGSRYIEDVPLIQVANVRIKIARIAAALAASVFSTDDGENLIVTAGHVKDVVTLIDRLYGMPEFGYKDRSAEAIKDVEFARKSAKRTKAFLSDHEGLAKFLRSHSRFKRQDIEEVMSYTREASNGVITRLHEYRMIKKESGFVVVAPVLHDLLREADID